MAYVLEILLSRGQRPIIPHLKVTHWGGVTHKCVSELTNIGSDNGLSPGRRPAIIWTNVGILLIWPLGTNSVKYESKFIHFHIRKSTWKCRLENDGYFVSASMCQYHGCWWSGNARSQGISSSYIDLVCPKHSSFNIRRVNSLYAELFVRNIGMHLHFMSFLSPEIYHADKSWFPCSPYFLEKSLFLSWVFRS